MRRGTAAVISAAMLCLLSIKSFAWTGDVLSKADTSQHVIALTFDDGPHPKRTAEILDILKKYNVRATFFAIGENVKLYPELIRREIDEGHEIGNHTYSHMFLKNSNAEEVEKEISSFDDLMLEMFEYKAKALRPPGGLYSQSLCSWAECAGYTVVLWSVDTLDWAHTPREAICEKITENAHDGDIILMHDYIAGDSPTPDVLKEIIPYFLSEGYKFVTVSELSEAVKKTGGE